MKEFSNLKSLNSTFVRTMSLELDTQNFEIVQIIYLRTNNGGEYDNKDFF